MTETKDDAKYIPKSPSSFTFDFAGLFGGGGDKPGLFGGLGSQQPPTFGSDHPDKQRAEREAAARAAAEQRAKVAEERADAAESSVKRLVSFHRTPDSF